jgi:hypothetical protein
MRSSAECLAKAVELTERAAEARNPQDRAELLELAAYWGRCAIEAARQDTATDETPISD